MALGEDQENVQRDVLAWESLQKVLGDCLCPKGARRPWGYQEIDSLTWEPGEALCVHPTMSTRLHSQALLQEGVGILGAQASPNIRAAPTLAVLMLKERSGCFPMCGGAWLLKGWSSLEMCVSTVRSLLDHQLRWVGARGLFFAEHVIF